MTDSTVNTDIILATMRNDLRNRPRDVTYADISDITGCSAKDIERFANDRMIRPTFGFVAPLYAFLYKTRQIQL